MKAIVCSEVGGTDTLRLTDLPSPKAKKDEIVVSVRAAGVNFPDVLMVQGKYQHVPPLPFIPGKEIAGVVKEVGEDVSHFKAGDRVCAYLRYGAFAEEVALKADYTVMKIPDALDFAPAAAFPLVYSTSMHLLNDRAKMQAGETLLVLGASGGVGIAAVQLGKLLGARVIACASSDEKTDFCRRHGADDVVNYSKENLREAINRLTAGKGVDVVCDPVGGDYTEPALRSMSWNGRYCVVGFAAGQIPKVPINLLLLKGCAMLGCAFGSNAQRDPTQFVHNLRQMNDWMADGKLVPVVTTSFPLEKTREALDDMTNRRVMGKVVIVM